MSKLQRNVPTDDFRNQYGFLRDWRYTLSVGELTQLGRQELFYSGSKFKQRYAGLARIQRPFVRSTTRERVLESAKFWMAGFYGQEGTPHSFHPDVQIIEALGFNNTLAHGACDALEVGKFSNMRDEAKTAWLAHFGTPIMQRLNRDLPNANLSLRDTANLMELCSAVTVDSPTGTISPFCELFDVHEWLQFNYYETLTKYYKTGVGNPLGAAQGIGFVNELIARMTDERVVDSTSTNRTLDDDPRTFPVGPDHRLFADFTHDSDMASIFFALNLYPWSPKYSTASMDFFYSTKGLFSASKATPFSARAYFEKMQCYGEEEELVRILVNDRVMPQPNCHSDGLGRCKLSEFLSSLDFARSMGNWEDCFKPENL